MQLRIEIDQSNRSVVGFETAGGFACGEIYDPLTIVGIPDAAAASLTLLLTNPETGTQLASAVAGTFTRGFGKYTGTVHLDTAAMLAFFPTAYDGVWKDATLEIRDSDQVFCICTVSIAPSPTAAASFTPQGLLDAVRRSDFAALSAIPARYTDADVKTLVNAILNLLKNGA